MNSDLDAPTEGRRWMRVGDTLAYSGGARRMQLTPAHNLPRRASPTQVGDLLVLPALGRVEQSRQWPGKAPAFLAAVTLRRSWDVTTRRQRMLCRRVGLEVRASARKCSPVLAPRC